jgi:hypothetical protein
MPQSYIKSLVKQGKGTTKSLEKKWDAAKKKAKDQDKGDNYGYITAIFKKMSNVDENYLNNIFLNILKESCIDGGECLNMRHHMSDMAMDNEDNSRENVEHMLGAGKYKLNSDDDMNGHYKIGDEFELDKDTSPVSMMDSTPVYELNINGMTVWLMPNSFESSSTSLTEDEGGGGGDAGYSGTSVSDVGGYETPMAMSTRTAPDLGTKYNWKKTNKEMKGNKSINPKLKKQLQDFKLA